jgi:integrase
VKRRKEADSVPEIWSVDLAVRILACVREELPKSLPYLVTGCWMGCRPFEIQRLEASMWDWERGYLDIGVKVAMKTMQQRFVPIPANVRALLQGREFRTITDDQVFLSKLLLLLVFSQLV